MPRQSIEYLNSRKENAKRKGRTIFMTANAVADRRFALQQNDALENAVLEAGAVFADFRSWFRNLPTVDQLMDGPAALDDLTF